MQKIKFLPFYLLSSLPLPLLFLLSDFTFFVVFHVIKYRRKVVKSNLINSFPKKSELEIKTIEKKFYKHLCDVLFETIKVLTISEKSARKRLSIKNEALIQRLHQENKSIIMYTSHYGNWEWISLFPLFSNYQTTAFYLPLTNPYFDELLKIIRSKFGLLCIEANSGYKTLLKFKQDNILSLNFIAGDQSPRKTATKHWRKFLNQDTAFLIGTDTIAKKSKQAVVYSSFEKVKRGCYEVNFILIEEFPSKDTGNTIIDKYAEILENNIHQHPEFWLWSHKRWKLEPPTES